MTIIAADGSFVQPQVVDYLDLYSGERYDVLITANQPVGTYVLIAHVLSYTGTLLPLDTVTTAILPCKFAFGLF
jgi:FtsP/CotA-like multicopper oxidase with cupredoxin domain